jgi:GNAT superfamily N-acetyltransferase
MTTIEGPLLGQASVCTPILEGLPEWFGIAEANAQYIRDIEVLPTFLARDDDSTEVTGFLTVKQHYPEAAEILVMGVRPDRHRGGAGSALVAAAEAWLRTEGVRFLQVKTQGPAVENPDYARTRAFYLGVGFTPLEQSLELWDEQNPALILIKTLT